MVLRTSDPTTYWLLAKTCSTFLSHVSFLSRYPLRFQNFNPSLDFICFDFPRNLFMLEDFSGRTVVPFTVLVQVTLKSCYKSEFYLLLTAPLVFCPSSHSFYCRFLLTFRSISLDQLTPKNIFRLESKPAAKILALCGSFLSTKIRHAKRDIVLCITFESFLSPGSVSITTKSMGDSEDRPT